MRRSFCVLFMRQSYPALHSGSRAKNISFGLLLYDGPYTNYTENKTILEFKQVFEMIYGMTGNEQINFTVNKIIKK